MQIVNTLFFLFQESRQSRYFAAPLCASWKSGCCYQDRGPQRSSREQFESREQRERARRGSGLQIPASFRPDRGRQSQRKKHPRSFLAPQIRSRLSKFGYFYNQVVSHILLLQTQQAKCIPVRAKRILVFVFSFKTFFW